MCERWIGRGRFKNTQFTLESMMRENYYKTAIENEEVFRNILRDLKNHKKERPMGRFIPEDLDTKSKLDDIFLKYSEGQRIGKFTILNFLRHSKDIATISFQDVAVLSGDGAELEYIVSEDNSVRYKENKRVWLS